MDADLKSLVEFLREEFDLGVNLLDKFALDSIAV